MQILLDGEDIVDLDPTYLRSQLAVVAQEPRLFNRTLRGNIEVGRVVLPWLKLLMI